MCQRVEVCKRCSLFLFCPISGAPAEVFLFASGQCMLEKEILISALCCASKPVLFVGCKNTYTLISIVSHILSSPREWLSEFKECQQFIEILTCLYLCAMPAFIGVSMCSLEIPCHPPTLLGCTTWYQSVNFISS